ncbi:MAG: 3-isopropylmalate dehydratase large subunit [Elusimicrobiota bacterium]|nr:3-isopropylmalate dehydratase large subunit [Elusimicrobiota bacterium]
MSLGKKIYLKNNKDRKKLNSGEFIEVDVDLILSNDITTPLAIDAFNQSGIGKMETPEKAVIVADHFTPNKDIDSAEQVKKVRDFARKWDLKFFDAGCGIEHILLPEKGLVVPGDIIIGADSHTVTYGALGAVASGVGSTDIAYAWATGKAWFKAPEAVKVVLNGSLQPHVSGKDIILYIISLIGADGALYKGLEFCGETLSGLSMESRFTIANMVIECGAKYGIMEPDEKTINYVEKRAQRPYSPLPEKYSIKEDKEFDEVMEIDCSLIEPQVAFPSSPANAYPVSSIEKVEVDQVVLGSCTNGMWEDFIKAAKVLKGKKAKEGLRFIVIPSTAAIYKRMVDEGLLSVFVDAGAIISPPTCGPCLGGHMGILASGEKALSTTNRNFVGRMGHKDSEVYLANPEVAAATAVRGYISAP